MCRLRITYHVDILFQMKPDATQEIHSWDKDVTNIAELFPYDCFSNCEKTLVFQNFVIREKRGPCIYEARKTIQTLMDREQVKCVREEKDESGHDESELLSIIPQYSDTFLVRDIRDDFEGPLSTDKNHVPPSENSWWDWVRKYPDFRFKYPNRPMKYDLEIIQEEKDRIARDHIEEWEQVS